MVRVCPFLVLCISWALFWSDSVRSETYRSAHAPICHTITIALHPDTHRLDVTDVVTVPESFGNSFTFGLHQGLNPVSSTPHVSLMRESESHDGVPLVTYRVSLPAGVRKWALEYSGTLNHPLEPDEKETVRGSRGTPGQISEEGAFLVPESHWYPQFDGNLLSFDLEVIVPHNWDAVSQGERTLHETAHEVRRVRWHCLNPQEGLSLVAGPFFEFSGAVNEIRTMVFLHEPNEALAGKYLAATARYVTMYDKLFGLYPYEKFALVENYWETGYGMPSFALMGPKVIRLPFIISSSYPHEILHNWWGNSVYPDLKTGNWCEGLTAYFADHLLREQRGTATEYRRDLLQRVTDYVSKENDFPLSRFRARHSAATQAIGYGKALMFFHMLRLDLGDDLFREGFRDFYLTNKFRLASYDDIRRSLESVSKKDLSAAFSQWVDGTGAPQIQVRDPGMHKSGKQYAVTVVLEQKQPGAPYRLRIPVAVTMKDRQEAYQTRVLLTEARQEFRFTVPDPPVRIDVDPQFDVFRRLAQGELPAALTQVFGARRLTIVLPSQTDRGLREAFSQLGRDWVASGPEQVQTITDDQMKVFAFRFGSDYPGMEESIREGDASTFSATSCGGHQRQRDRGRPPAPARRTVSRVRDSQPA